MGNIYHRRIEEVYTSSGIEIPIGLSLSYLEWDAQSPNQTAVRFQIRSAIKFKDLNWTDWVGPDGRGTHYYNSGSRVKVADEDRWLQYWVLFTSPDGGSTPILEEVRFVIE